LSTGGVVYQKKQAKICCLMGRRGKVGRQENCQKKPKNWSGEEKLGNKLPREKNHYGVHLNKVPLGGNGRKKNQKQILNSGENHLRGESHWGRKMGKGGGKI